MFDKDIVGKRSTLPAPVTGYLTLFAFEIFCLCDVMFTIKSLEQNVILSVALESTSQPSYFRSLETNRVLPFFIPASSIFVVG